MGFFDNDKEEQIKDLQTLIGKYQRERKMLKQESADMRNEIASLRAELQLGAAQLVEEGLKLKRMRDRQKASVERANRYLSQLNKLKSPI